MSIAWHGVIAAILTGLAVGPANASGGEGIGRVQIQRLQAASIQLQVQEAAGGWPELGDGPSLRVGMKDPRVTLLRRRLGLVDAGNAEFDETLRAAVRKYQQSHGLTADGVVGKSTRSELNVSLQARLAQVEVNIERWRAQTAEPVDRFVLVNIPFMELRAVRSGQVDLTARVVVGKPRSQTPVFEAEIGGLVFAPYWNIPARIARSEIFPKARRDSDYLARNQIEPVPGMPGQLRQRPGPENSLGLLKFDLPNPHDVYLHDTPAKSLFDSPIRAFSHGCVRVAAPELLATWLLEPTGRWDLDAVRAAMAEGTTRRVDLARPVPVRLVYFTVWARADGTVDFRRDIYGLDGSPVVRYATRRNLGGCVVG